MGADQFDNLSADMFDEFDIDMGDDNSNKKKGSETLQNVSELLKSTGKGALKGLHNELKDRFGNTSQLVDETIATVDDFKKLQQDLASEISPAVNSMKQITLRSMPMVEKIMPKKWYDSIKKKLEESIIPAEKKRDMEAEIRNETIRSSLQSIFEGQAEVQKQMIIKQDTERMVDRKLNEEHFKASYEALNKIGDSVSTVAEFLTGTYTGYLKKSLELKYQGLFVMKDIHKATVAIAKISEERLKEISKNTSVPDYMKAGNLRAGGLAASRGSRLQTYSEYQSSFRSTMMQNISKSLMGSVKNVTRGIIPQLDMMTSMMEMMGGGEKLTPMKLAAMGLGVGAQLGAKHLFGDKLKKYDGLRDLIENKGRFMKSKGISWLQQFAERHRGEYGTLLGWIADKIPSFNKQAVRNSMLEGANEAVPFDNTTRQTIVEVMPRHLERIGNLVEALQQTLAPNAKINQMTFNVHQRKLTTVEEAREDFISKEFGSKEDRARRMGETMGKFRAILLTNKNAKKGTAKAEKLQEQMSKMEDHLKRFLINSATAARFFDYETLLEYYQALSSPGAENRTDITSSYIKLVFDGIPEDHATRKAFVQLLMDMTKDPKTNRPSGMMVDRINAAISDRMNDTNIQEMMAKASEGFGQSQLFSDIATHKEGVKNAGLLNMLDPKLKKKKTTFYNPKTGQPYSQKELKDLRLDLETQDDAERTASYEMDELRHLKAEEEKLRQRWKHRGGKEGDFADKLSGVLGGAAYATPDFINNDLTKATDWLKGKYQKTKQGVTDFFSDDTVIGRTYSKAKSKYDESEQKKPHVNSVVKTGPTTYVISASDLRLNRYSETINVSTPLQPGTLPVEEINKLCAKKRWVFDMSDPSFRYSEITEENDIPEHYEEVKPEPAYTVTPGASGNYTVGGSSKGKRRSTKQEKVRTAADVAEEAVAFDADSRTSLRRWIPDKLDRIIELLGGGKPTNGPIPPTGYNPTDGVEWRTKPTYTQEGSRRISFDAVNSAGGATSTTEMQVGNVTSNVQGGTPKEHRPMGFSALMEERAKESSKVQDVTGKLVETFQSREELVKYFPESMQEQVGTLYDNAVKSGHSIGKFLNKLGTDLKATGAQKKILDDLKRISTVIPSADQRKKYLGEVLSQLSSYKSTITDSKKRKEALDNIRKKMVSGLEDIQKEVQEKGVGGAIKSKATSGIRGLWRKLRYGWLKFRRSKIGRWIMAHIPDSVKKDVKEAFEKAKGDVKKGTEAAKKVIEKYNKNAKPGEQKIDPKMLNATQLEGSGDEGEFTPQDIAKDAIPDATLQHADEEVGQSEPVAAKQPGFFKKIGSFFHRDQPQSDIKNVNKVGFFGKMKGLFHRNKPEVKEAAVDATPATTTVQATKKEESKAPEGDLKFEGEAESVFHSDFRLFAQRQIADNQSLLSAIMGIPGGGKGKGILGSIIGAGGKIGGGLIGAYGRMMAAMMGMYGNIAKGVLSGGGRVIGGALKAAPAVGKALLTPAKWLGKASWWTTKKTVGGAWKGGKWLGSKAWKGITHPFRKKDAKPLEEPVPEDKQYYQDANGRWHGPDGRFVSADQVPEQYKTAQAGAKPSLVSRIKDKVSGWFSKSSRPSKKKEGEEDDNIWNRKGWGGLFRTAWDGAKKVGSGIAKFFSKEKEGDSEVPKAGRKLGIDLLLNKITEIYDLLKEERDRQVEKEQKEEKAKKDAEQAEANMSAEEQQAANEKRLEERKKKMAEDAAAKAAAQGGEGTVQGQGSGEGQGDEEGGLMSDLLGEATDWIGGKVLKGTRGLTGKSLKLLRKTKLGRKFLHSGAGKLMRKGIGTFLQKGKIGLMGRIGKAGSGIARVGGRGIAAATKGVAGLFGKGAGALGKGIGAVSRASGGLASSAVTGGASALGKGAMTLASKGGMLGKLGSAGVGLASKLGGLGSLAGGLAKFAGPVGLAITAAKGLYDGYKGWGNAGVALGVDQDKLNFAEKASGALGGVASGLTFGLLDRDKATRGVNWLSRKIGFSTDLDADERADLEYKASLGDEAAKKKLEEAKGGLWKGAKNLLKYATPVGLAATGAAKAGGWLAKKLGFGKKDEKKEGVEKTEEKDSGKLSIPQNVAQSLMDTSDTMAEFKSELRDYVDEHYPDASASSRRALIEATVTTMWGNKGGVSEKTTESSEESKMEESSKDKITGTKLDGVKAVLKGVPKQKSGWGSKLLKAATFASPVGLAAMGAKALNDKFDLTGKAAKGLKWAGSKALGNLKDTWKGAKWLGSKYIEGNKAVGNALLGGAKTVGKGIVLANDKVNELKAKLRGKVVTGAKAGLKWARGKAADLAGSAAGYLEDVAANSGSEGFITDLKDIAATGSRALADKLKGGQEERAAYVEKIMSMPAEEAVKMVGPEEYDKLRREYQHTRMKHHLGLWDRMTGKQIDTSGMMAGGKDQLITNDAGQTFSSDFSTALNASIVNRRRKKTGTVDGLHGALETRIGYKEVTGPDGKSHIEEEFVDNDKENIVEAMNDLDLIGYNKQGPGEYSNLAQSKRSAKDVYDALDRFAPKKQTVWDKITGTKPKSTVKTASSISDQQMKKHDGVNAYLESKQPSKGSDAADQQAANTEALVQATTSGNSNIVDKLAEMVNLMKEQIVVTSDSKVAQEKATSEGAQKALTAAMAYAKETAQNAVAASRPKPRREPAINVAKPVPA